MDLVSIFRAIYEFTQPRDCTAHCQNSETVPISRLRTRLRNLKIGTSVHAISRLHNFCWMHNWTQVVVIEFPSCIRMYVRKELLQLRVTINNGHVLKPPMPEISGKFANSVGRDPRVQRDLRPVEFPCSRLHQLESSQLSSISQLTLTPLHKCIAQSQDWHTVFGFWDCVTLV